MVLAGHTFDEVGVQHLGLFKLEDGVFGVPSPEVDICQAHQEVHVVPQERLLLQRAETGRKCSVSHVVEKKGHLLICL